jgi:hypothetical protein
VRGDAGDVGVAAFQLGQGAAENGRHLEQMGHAVGGQHVGQDDRGGRRHEISS